MVQTSNTIKVYKANRKVNKEVAEQQKPKKVERTTAKKTKETAEGVKENV